MFEITKNTVIASDGFEEHPESYRPRVFVAENPDCKDAELVHEVYELLTDGQAIPWDCLPRKECCGFDFWTIYADGIHDITMNRAPRVLPTEVKVQGKRFPLLKPPQDLIEALAALQTIPPDKTRPATTGAGYCTCKIEQPLLDHLPEGSY